MYHGKRFKLDRPAKSNILGTAFYHCAYYGRHTAQGLPKIYGGIRPVYHTYTVRRSVVVASLCIVAAIGILAPPTIAYLVHASNEVENSFTYAWVSCAVTEELTADNEKTEVKIQNTGNTAAYIRATIVVTWKDAAGNVYGPSQPELGKDYTLDLDLNNGWEQIGDYYYYTKEVEPSGETGVLITSCNLLEGITAPEGYGLSVEILADAIQSNPDEAVNEAWEVVEASSGTLTEVTSSLEKS